jgi:hypothetical protein
MHSLHTYYYVWSLSLLRSSMTINNEEILNVKWVSVSCEKLSSFIVVFKELFNLNCETKIKTSLWISFNNLHHSLMYHSIEFHFSHSRKEIHFSHLTRCHLSFSCSFKPSIFVIKWTEKKLYHFICILYHSHCCIEVQLKQTAAAAKTIRKNTHNSPQMGSGAAFKT